MTVDPFGAAIENGRLYGRGACDIKGGMAAMLAAFARLVRDRPRGACNLLMACSVDEEHTFLGIQEFVKRGLKADLAVVAEPTNLRIVKAHKGVCRWHVLTPGRSCHSSAPELGVNAIYRMGRLLGGIERYATELRASRSDPLLGPPTLSVGRIEGGTSVNTVPDRCRIEVDRRLIPGEEAQAAPDGACRFPEADSQRGAVRVQPALDQLPGAGPRVIRRIGGAPGRSIDAVVGRHEVISVPYGTDASTLAQAGIPSVVFGPGDIAKAAHLR